MLFRWLSGFGRLLMRGEPRELTPQEKVAEAIAREFEAGVNFFSVRGAYDKAVRTNEEFQAGLSRDVLLTMVRDSALLQACEVEHMMYGGRDQTKANILAEIENLHAENA